MIMLALILLGLCFGSFVNALVWRIHEQESGKRSKRRELSILHGRSMCVHCKHTLSWYDLLPVISWLSLKGMCRYCKRPISMQYPLVEVVTAVLFILSYAFWPYGFGEMGVAQFSLWVVFLLGMIALTVYDLRWMLLPNRIVYMLIAISIIHAVVRIVSSEQPVQQAIEAVVGFLAIGGLFYVLFQISDGQWIGGGDVKLAFAIGPLVGSGIFSIMVIFFASLMGTIASLPLLANRKLKVASRIPFGPYLVVATIIVYIFGGRIVEWYTMGVL